MIRQSGQNNVVSGPSSGAGVPAVTGLSGISPILSGVSPAISDVVQALSSQEVEGGELEQNYDVGGMIGRGASGVVYEAWRKSDRLHVVIKLLQITFTDENEAHVAVRRFYREARLISSLHEEHIVKCIDYGQFQGMPCMVLEFVEGLPLDKLIQKYGPLSLANATEVIDQLLQALIETHGKGIIHRDIKPGNIMVFDSPPPYTIRVLDFGISTVLDGLQSKTLMTQAGNVRGTPSYMAPELFTGDTRASVESDLYAVGLVYLECLTGGVAISDSSFMRVAYKQVNEALIVPGFVPECIADIIFRLCAKLADERYHSAADALEEIRAAIPGALAEEDKCTAEYEASGRTKVHVGKVPARQGMGLRTVHVFMLALLAATLIIVLLALLLLSGDDDARDASAGGAPPADFNVQSAEDEEDRVVDGAVRKVTERVGDAWSRADAAMQVRETIPDAPAPEQVQAAEKSKSERKSKSRSKPKPAEAPAVAPKAKDTMPNFF